MEATPTLPLLPNPPNSNSPKEILLTGVSPSFKDITVGKIQAPNSTLGPLLPPRTKLQKSYKLNLTLRGRQTAPVRAMEPLHHYQNRQNKFQSPIPKKETGRPIEAI